MGTTSEKIQNFLFQFAIDKFHTLKGLAASWIILIFLSVGAHVIIGDSFDFEWISFILVSISLLGYWFVFKYKYPKNDPKKTGIVIALHAKDAEAQSLKQKFINELEKNINSALLGDVFNIIILKNHHAETIKKKEDIKNINKKINGNFYLFGDVQRELDGDSYRYFINLDGYVDHHLVPIPISQELSMDFRNLLPKEIDFKDLFGYRCIRATSKIAYLSAKYVVGVASFLSENPFLAYRLHKNLEKEFSEYGEIKKEMDKSKANIVSLDLKYLKQLKGKLLRVISNETLLISRIFYKNGKIEESLNYLQIAEQKNGENYSVWLFKAILAFEIDHDPVTALKFIKKAEKCAATGNEWRYSKAFLLFWIEKYPEAYLDCQKISKSFYANEVFTVDEVTGFNLKILENTKDKPQLYFWIGYLVYKKKKQLSIAQKYFETFLVNSNGRIPFLEEKAKTFISEIKNQVL